MAAENLIGRLQPAIATESTQVVTRVLSNVRSWFIQKARHDKATTMTRRISAGVR